MPNTITIADAGRLIAQKGNIKLYEKIVRQEGAHYVLNKCLYTDQYRVLTSLVDDKPFKTVEVGKQLLSPYWGYSTGDTKHKIFGCESIPQFVRKIWEQLYKDRNWMDNDYSMKSDAVPQSSWTVVSENHETDEKVTIANVLTSFKKGIFSFPPPKYITLQSKIKEKNGEVVEEYGRLYTSQVNCHLTDKPWRISSRIYRRDMTNPKDEGKITLTTGYSSKPFQAINAKNKNCVDVKHLSMSSDEYNIGGRYLNYDV